MTGGDYHSELLKYRRTDNPDWWNLSLIGFPLLHATSTGNIFNFNDEYIYKYDKRTNTLYKYLKIADELKQILFRRDDINITLSESNGYFIIYLRENNKASLHVIDVETNIMNSFVIPYAEYAVFIDDHIHLIDKHGQHVIGFKKQDKFVITKDCLCSKETRKDAVAIYISSKQCIMLIGGQTEAGEAVKNIGIFSMKTQTWTTIDNLYFNRYGFGAVLSPNERYVLLFGGMIPGVGPTDDISILDIRNDNQLTLRESNIRCPYKGVCSVVRAIGFDIKDSILIMGYMKQCYKNKEFNQYVSIPTDIISMIHQWYCGDMVHYFFRRKHWYWYSITNQHFIVNTQKIL